MNPISTIWFNQNLVAATLVGVGLTRRASEVWFTSLCKVYSNQDKSRIELPNVSKFWRRMYNDEIYKSQQGKLQFL